MKAVAKVVEPGMPMHATTMRRIESGRTRQRASFHIDCRSITRQSLIQ